MERNAWANRAECTYRLVLELRKLKKQIALLACLIFAFPNLFVAEANALDHNSVASIFSRMASDKSLSNPAIVVMDKKTGEVVFEKNSTSPRKPASVLKLLSAAAAFSYLEPTHRFTTSLWVGAEKKSIVIQGSLDPWFSSNDAQAKKMGRTSLPRIESNALSSLKRENSGSTKNSTIYFSNLYSQDIANINSYFLKRGVRVTFKRVTSQKAIELSSQQILSSDSPELQEILAFTLTWSDNLLAERIARLASAAAGYPLNDVGVAQTFEDVFNNLGIDATNLVIQDGSGLSRENQMTALQAGNLLLKIRENPKLASLVEGLPIGGVSGTLRHRFLTTAPQAVGLIKAKTGKLRGTANLAGYVESGDREYAFVIFADRLIQSNKTEDRARLIMDKLLGKVAFPILTEEVRESSKELETINTPAA